MCLALETDLEIVEGIHFWGSLLFGFSRPCLVVIICVVYCKLIAKETWISLKDVCHSLTEGLAAHLHPLSFNNPLLLKCQKRDQLCFWLVGVI